MFALARRSGQPLAVALIDLDHFKTINDRHGHDAGDRVLAAFGALLRAQARQSDVLCRWGGEEFCLLMPQTVAAAARHKLEQLLALWQAERIDATGSPIAGLGFSAGVCDSSWPDGSGDALLKTADQALLQAKRCGRAQVRLAELGVPARLA